MNTNPPLICPTLPPDHHRHGHPPRLGGFRGPLLAWSLAGGLTLLSATLTASAEDTHSRSPYRDAMRLLTRVERSVNEWGTFTVSDPLVLPQTGQFGLGLTNVSTTDYIAKARDAHAGEMVVVDFSRFAARADVQVDTVPGLNAGKPAASITVSNSLPAAPANFGDSRTNYSADLRRNRPSRISERQAMEQGISDKIYERLLSSITYPEGSGSRRKVIFLVVQVSCQPGWRTENNYVADLQVNLGYASRAKAATTNDNPTATSNPTNSVMLMAAHRPETPDGQSSAWTTSSSLQPSVYAVLPLTDSLQFDLGSRRRHELDLAANLAGTFAAQGMTAEARMLARLIRERDAAIESASMLPVATTYTDGASFGIRVYPRPQAIEKPGDVTSGAGRVLQAVSFPVLVAIVVDDDVTEEKWTHLRVENHTRWIPCQGRLGPIAKTVRIFWPNYRGGNQRDQRDLSELHQLTENLRQAALDLGTNVRPGQPDPTRDAARRALDVHRANLAGLTRFVELPELRPGAPPAPAPDKLALRDFTPTHVLDTDQDTAIVLRLVNLPNPGAAPTPGSRRLWISGIQATGTTATPRDGNSTVISGLVTLPEAHGTRTLSVAVDYDGWLANADVKVEFPPAEPPDTTADHAGLKINAGAKLKIEGQTPVDVEVRQP